MNIRIRVRLIIACDSDSDSDSDLDSSERTGDSEGALYMPREVGFEEQHPKRAHLEDEFKAAAEAASE